MKIHIDINEKYNETAIKIESKEWSNELQEIVTKLKENQSKKLIGISEDQSILLSPEDIDYIYAENRKVFAVNRNQKVEIKLKL